MYSLNFDLLLFCGVQKSHDKSENDENNIKDNEETLKHKQSLKCKTKSHCKEIPPMRMINKRNKKGAQIWLKVI